MAHTCTQHAAAREEETAFKTCCYAMMVFEEEREDDGGQSGRGERCAELCRSVIVARLSQRASCHDLSHGAAVTGAARCGSDGEGRATRGEAGHI